MTRESLRDRLVQSLEAAQLKEALLLGLCDDSPQREAGGWTARDHIAHLNTWREHAVLALDAARREEPYEGPGNDSDLDARNAEIYEAHREDSAATVSAAAGASYAALIEAVRACSDADLLRERPGNGGPIWLVVPGNGHGHVAQHLTYWAVEHDDPSGAEEAAAWSHALDSDLFPENQPVADYNFACFYARQGNADDALPLLRAALRGRPGLRAYALDDADIEPIRDDPRVASLLGP
ncbi:MAG: TPR end-of-group domain-containing protein [Candidatus Dormibacteria bacterium]